MGGLISRFFSTRRSFFRSLSLLSAQTGCYRIIPVIYLQHSHLFPLLFAFFPGRAGWYRITPCIIFYRLASLQVPLVAGRAARASALAASMVREAVVYRALADASLRADLPAFMAGIAARPSACVPDGSVVVTAVNTAHAQLLHAQVAAAVHVHVCTCTCAYACNVHVLRCDERKNGTGALSRPLRHIARHSAWRAPTRSRTRRPRAVPAGPRGL